MIDIIFVPLWLEKHLKSLGLSVTKLHTMESAKDILSTIDFNNYLKSKEYFEQKYLVDRGLAKYDPRYSEVLYELTDLDITRHLYGDFYSGTGNTLTPTFDVNVIGDAVYVTVRTTNTGVDAVCSGEVNDLTKSLIDVLVQYVPVKEIASWPMFRNFIQTVS